MKLRLRSTQVNDPRDARRDLLIQGASVHIEKQMVMCGARAFFRGGRQRDPTHPQRHMHS